MLYSVPKYFSCALLILFATIMGGCKSYSKYTIDEKPSVKIDSSL